MSRIQSRNASSLGCEVSRGDFIKAFHDVPKTSIAALSDVKSKIDTAVTILSKPQEDWTKRASQLKNIRSIMIHGENVIEPEQMLQQLIKLTDALELSIKDLRSQILREAAITCCFIVQKYGNDVHQIGEQVLPAALAQVSVSTKIMATSGALLSAFIVEYIQTKQIFTTITSYSTSKDKNQRRHLAKLLEVVVGTWNEKMKKQVLRQTCELIKAAICDADSETRTAGRKAFNKLDELHNDEAEKIFQAVDAPKQKMLRSGEAASSNLSVNSERGSLPVRSKLSAGARAAPNISAKFLAARSASAIDTKQITRPLGSGLTSGTPGSKYSRPGTVRGTNLMTMSKVDTSPGGMTKFTKPALGMGPRTFSNLRAKAPVANSQPGSRNSSPPRRSSTTSTASTFSQEMQRVKSNLGPKSFVASLTPAESAKFQRDMNNIQNQMRQPSRTEDDEFLLPKRSFTSKTPQKNPLDVSRVDAVLRACAASAMNDKKEGIKMLSTIVVDPNLTDIEIKQIGTTVNRLLADVTNTTVLESVAAFVRVHHNRLGDWLKLGLVKLFNKMGSENVPHAKRQITATIEAVLTSFNPYFQFKSVCELMCDPVQLLAPKPRIALLEYSVALIGTHMERGSAFNNKETKAMVKKLFAWVGDQKNGKIYTANVEKIICCLFALNNADFSALFNDFDPDYRDSAYRILQTHGHDEHSQKIAQNGDEEEKCVRTNIATTAAQIGEFVGQSNKRMMGMLSDSPKGSPRSVTSPHQKPSLGPLKPLNSTLNSSANQGHDDSFNESFERLKLNSTTHLIDDHVEQEMFVKDKLEKIMNGQTAEQHDALSTLHTMLCEGSFTLWEQNFPKLLLAIFDTMSKSESDSNKKLAIRILTKMCTAQAARLFDSTEMAVFRVLDAVVNSKDGTMNVIADDCLKTLATHLPLAKIAFITKCIMDKEPLDEARAGLVLKMTTRLFEEMPADELEAILDDVAPCAIKAYDSSSSTVRKSAVYCLVAMVNRFGKEAMHKYLSKLSGSKLNLIQVYISRTMSSSSHSHV